MTLATAPKNNPINHKDSPVRQRIVLNGFTDEGSKSIGNGAGGSSFTDANTRHGRAATAATKMDHGSNDVKAGRNDQIKISPLFPHSSSMDFKLIREEDAFILEQGVEEKSGADLADFDDEGRRLETSRSNSSLTEFDNENIVPSKGEETDGTRRSQRSCDVLVAGVHLDESRNDLSPVYAASPLAYESAYESRKNLSSVSPLQTSTPSRNDAISTISSSDNILMPAIAEDSTICHEPSNSVANPRPQSHITEPVEHSETCSQSNCNFSGLPSAVRDQITEEIDHEALAQRIASGRSTNRSNSFERRMCESAQFAKAVGEDSSLVIRKIIEEDSSSDFDDDEIDQGGANIVLLQGNERDEILSDDQVELQNDEGRPEDIAPGAPEEIEPNCVSNNLAKETLEGEACSNQPNAQQQGRLPQLLTTLEVETADSAAASPDPMPCKPKPSVPRRYVDWKFTRQHSSNSILGKNGTLTSSSGEANFAYRGICSNPPEITKRGMARGNYAQLHRKAWLEVSDEHHRYGKNLRMYYKHWEELGHPFLMFFDWLDSKGEAMGNPLPNLPDLPRSELDSDTVLYITNPEVSASYALNIVVDMSDGSGIITDQNGNPINTGKEGWIFILRDHVLYGSQKVTAPKVASPTEAAISKPRHRFHHSSFFGGKAVASAGIFITNEQGRLTHLYPHSGHYRPGEAHMQRALFFFQHLGVELSTFSVDMQQIFKVSRKLAPKGNDTGAAGGGKIKGGGEKDKENNATIENGKSSKVNCGGKHAPSHQNVKKSKKTDCLHLMGGLEVACFLAHKANMIEKGVFHQIHKIRRVPNVSRGSVCFIMSVVNN